MSNFHASKSFTSLELFFKPTKFEPSRNFRPLLCLEAICSHCEYMRANSVDIKYQTNLVNSWLFYEHHIEDARNIHIMMQWTPTPFDPYDVRQKLSEQKFVWFDESDPQEIIYKTIMGLGKTVLFLPKKWFYVNHYYTLSQTKFV